MKLSKYPKTQYESISVRFGLAGIEPELIQYAFAEDFLDCPVLSVVVNMYYPSDVIASGNYLNPRILRMFDVCFDELGLCLVNSGNYPETKNDSYILPVVGCECIHNYDLRIYLLIDRRCNSLGELIFADLPVFMGDFYGENAVIFIALPEELNIRMKDLLKLNCEKEDIRFTEWPEVRCKKIQPPLMKRFFSSASEFFHKLFRYMKAGIW